MCIRDSLLIVKWRYIEIYEVNEFDEPFIEVEKRHVTSKTTTQAAGSKSRFRHTLSLFTFTSITGLTHTFGEFRLASISLPMGFWS